MALSPLQSPIPLLIPPPGETLPPPQFDSDRSRNTSSERKPSSLRARHKKSTKELTQLFEQEAREALNLQRVLVNLTEQLNIERNRADEAERKVQEVLIQLRTVNDAKNAALREASCANEALNLYKRRLEQAQNEIFRAQEILKVVDAQRHEAEKMAAKDRSTAHKLREQNLVFLAKEEGRRIGLKEGFDRGRDMGYHEGYTRARSATRYDEHDEESYDSVDEGTMSPLSGDSDMSTREPPPPPPPPRRAPSEPPTPVPPPATSGDIRPIPVYNTAPSPHPPVPIPPDGMIPLSDRDSYIHLPPPHELSRPPTMPGTPRVRSPVREGAEDAPLRVPPPESVRSRRSMRSMRSLDRIRRSSPESNSTTFSQFEMVKDPGPSLNRSPMSIIPEVLSAQASPNPSTLRDAPSLRQQPSVTTPTIAVARAGPSPRTAMANLAELEAFAMQGVYTRTRSSSSSSDSSQSKNQPVSDRRQSQGSMNTIPDINIEPPSRPPSLNRRSSSDVPPPRRMGDFLSPEDAHRIRALPPEQPPEPPPVAPVESATVHGAFTTPIVLPDGRLPIGFVPSTFTPAPPQNQTLPPSEGPSGGSGMPGGLTNFGGGDVVIPDRSLFGGENDESGSSSDRSSGLGSDSNTLTTPPQRSRTPLTSYIGTSRLSAAGVPLPPSTVAGTPSQASRTPLTSYTGVSRLTAAGLPLPPSTISGSPRSGAGYLYSPAPDPMPSKPAKKALSQSSDARSSRSRKK